MGDVAALEHVDDHVPPQPRVDGIIIGELVGFSEDGMLLIDFPWNPQDNAIRARSTVALHAEDVGREVALLLEGGDPLKPLVIGAIVHPEPRRPPNVNIERHGERIDLTSEREIVLRCGAASLTLTRAGKILIRGSYVCSHSTGVNRIKGSAVHIN